LSALLLPLRSHLDELRSRLKVVFLSFLIILIVLVFFPANPIYSFQNANQYLSLVFLEHTVIAQFLLDIKGYILPANWNLIGATGIGEGMEIYFVAALLFAAVIDMPVIAYETYRFIDPALKPNERKMIYPFITAASGLFVVGILFGYFVLAKLLVIALSPFYVAAGISFQVDAAAFYFITLLIIGATGISFTTPVFIYTLISLRVLSAETFTKNRIIVWFILWVITGLILTPDGGPLLDLVIFIPIVTMVEIAVWLGRRSVGGRGSQPTRLPPPPPPSPAQTFRQVKCPSCGRIQNAPSLFCEFCGKGIA
jgi:sec-independent protein translocase protein TatC